MPATTRLKSATSPCCTPRPALPWRLAADAAKPGARCWRSPEVNVILADDGLQHYALARDIELAVVDGGRGF